MKFRVVLVAVALLFTSVTTEVVASGPAGAFPSANVTINGHGNGHGRGLGQYGSLGYAINSGWNYTQITDHYYGGTSQASASNLTIGVRMIELDGADTVVTSESQFSVGSVTVPANQAALVHRTGNNAFAIQTASSCSGPWATQANVTGPVYSTPSNPGSNLNQVLKLCIAGVGSRGVEGNVEAYDDNGTQRTINNLPIESYLKGVVPRESPASWGDLGNGSGINALEAQAIAARSYALSAGVYSYATTCDTTACQVYGGDYLNDASITDSRSNTAVSNTAGIVRRDGNGNISRTEFSSSTGGYTAGGTFPAVVDDGDTVSQNGYHNWTSTIPVSTIQSIYPSIGTLQSIIVTARNGIGDYGGRVTQMAIVGTNGTVSVTGDQFRSSFATPVHSNWFQIQGQPSGGVSGYWEIANDGGVFALGGAGFYGSMGGKPLNQPIIGLAPQVDSRGYWEVASDGGIFSWGSSTFSGSMGGKPLNRPIVGMTPTADGGGYWEVASDGGIFAFGDAGFYGSMGGKPLNKPIVGMAASPSGHGYWLVASDGGIFAFGDAPFYGSTGSLSLRQPVVAMTATPAGHGYLMVAADGGIFAFGDAVFNGSLPAANVNTRVTSMALTKTGNGYAIAAANGNIYSFGDAPQFGNLTTLVPNFRGTVLGIAPSA